MARAASVAMQKIAAAANVSGSERVTRILANTDPSGQP